MTEGSTPTIKVLYENENLLVVNKPVGLIVDRSDTHDQYTLQDWVEENIDLSKETQEPQKAGGYPSGFFSRSGIVHRLDKDTSGVIITAKNQRTFDFLQKQFQKREVGKKYAAIVYGHLKDIDENQLFTVNAPIARNPGNREKFAIVDGGKEAVTEFKIIKKIKEKDDLYSVMECYPKTGRTHQIRVHLAALGNPVVGDKLYSGKTRFKKNRRRFPRQLLHASEITFKDPKDKKMITVKSDIPADIANMLDLA